jgi:hypothetical protein
VDIEAILIGSAVESAALRPIVPAAGFAATLDQRRADNPAVSGKLHSYRWPAATLGFTVPLTMVDSGTRCDLTHWWRGQKELVFTWNPSGAPQSPPMTALVRMVNAEEPCSQWAPGVAGMFRGGLVLRETRGVGATSGSPFLLDDTGFGVLDGAANVIL